MNGKAKKLSKSQKKEYLFFAWSLIIIGILFYAIVGVVLLNNGIRFWSSGKVDWDLSNKVGCFVGGVIGPIWTLVGAVFLYQTILLQVQALNNSSAALKHSSRQQFENVLFNMMQMQMQIKNNIACEKGKGFIVHDDKTSGDILKGEDFFAFTKEEFTLWYHEYDHPQKSHVIINPAVGIDQTVENKSTPAISNPAQRIDHKYSRFYDYFRNYLDHYFKHMETLLNLLEQGELMYKSDDSNEKLEYDFYHRMFQAQLSKSELFHLFYACQAEITNERFPQLNRLVKKYKLLELLTNKELANHEFHPNLLLILNS